MPSLFGWQTGWVSTTFSAVVFVAHLVVAARAITRPGRTPASRVAWVAVIMTLPLVGILAYLLLGETSIGRRRVAGLRSAEQRLALPTADTLAPVNLPARASEVFRAAAAINGLQPTGGNRIALLGDPDAPPTEPARNSVASMDVLVAAIDAARDHVHVCFYIWLDDHAGGAVAAALSAAARRGVRCRVMVDALGSRRFVRTQTWRDMVEAGVHTVVTLDDTPRIGNLAVGRPDLRNHRKIVVIDNDLAFVGSQNCADPEFRTEPAYAPWIDLLFRCEGPVARQAQYLFLTTWMAETGEDLAGLPAADPPPPRFDDGVAAQVFGTGPDQPGDPMTDAFVTTLYAARSELLITTPYFVPDAALMGAICGAARRGVRTRIVFPARNNSRLVGLAARSTYPALLDAGVEVYEFPLGLLHSKSITVDGEFTLVGSSNMDRRSLQLNFENNLIVADRVLTAAIRERQESYVTVSDAVAHGPALSSPFWARLVQNTVGMLAPVL